MRQFIINGITVRDPEYAMTDDQTIEEACNIWNNNELHDLFLTRDDIISYVIEDVDES